MAKKKHRKQKKQVAAKPALSLADLEIKFHKSLESFDYRPAIKFAKELHRQQPEKYQALLLKALQGLYRELVAKKQLTRAEAIMTQIMNLADASATDIMELSLALQSGIITPQHEKIACLKIVDLQGKDLTEADKNIIIDIFIGAPESPEYHPTDSFSRQLHADLIAVRNAFKLICDKQYDTAMDNVSNIKRSSLLAPWRLLLKGITAYYQGADEKALTAFKKLLPTSTPAKVAESYLFLLKEAEASQNHAKKEAVLQNVVLLTTSEDPDKLLARAEILWNTGRYRDSFRRIKPLFNDLDANSSPFKKRLLRFYCNSLFALTPEQQANYLEYMGSNILPPEDQNPPLLKAAFFRIAAIKHEDFSFAEEKAVELWDFFLAEHSLGHPKNSAFNAAIYAHQADLYARNDNFDDNDHFSLLRRMMSGFESFDDEIAEAVDYSQAEKLYKKALKSAPENIEINLKLLQLYENRGSKEKSKTNRLLDELIRKFPDNKEILLKAGISCLERKALPKGLKYLYQAARLDPTDNKIKEFIVIGSIRYGWKLASASNPKRYRSLLQETLPYCIASRQQFNLSPSTLRARWAAMELYQDEHLESRELLNQALEADKSLHPDEVLYFFRLYAGVMNLQNKELQNHDKQLRKIFRTDLDLDRSITFSKIILYNIQVCDKEEDFIEKEIKRLNKTLSKLAKKGSTPEHFLDIANFALSPHNENQKLALTYLRQGHRVCPDDLQIWLAKLSLELDNARPVPSAAKMGELDDLIEQALETNDQEIAQKGEELIEVYQNKIAWFRDEYEFEEDSFENDYFGHNDYEDEIDLLPPGTTKPPKNWPRRRTLK